jgi:hypothetical protein
MAGAIDHKRFLTQSELAERWKISESSVKNWRERGHLPYFRLPQSSRILYPVDAIEEVEKLHTTPAREVVRNKRQAEIRRKRPDVSATEKEWRI